jgi:hypothetical protein
VTISIRGESYRLKDKRRGSLSNRGGESPDLDCLGNFTPVISGKVDPLSALAWDGWVADRQTIFRRLRTRRPFVLATETPA